MKYIEIIYTLVATFFFLMIDTTLASSSENFSSFLAGVLLIEENKNLTQAQKAHEYRQLQQLTGVCGLEAIRFIDSFRNRPLELKALYGSIIIELTGTKKTNPSGKKQSYNNN